MYEVVKATLARQLRIDPERVTLDAQIKRDLGADSVDILQLLMRLEDGSERSRLQQSHGNGEMHRTGL